MIFILLVLNESFLRFLLKCVKPKELLIKKLNVYSEKQTYNFSLFFIKSPKVCIPIPLNYSAKLPLVLIQTFNLFQEFSYYKNFYLQGSVSRYF